MTLSRIQLDALRYLAVIHWCHRWSAIQSHLKVIGHINANAIRTCQALCRKGLAEQLGDGPAVFRITLEGSIYLREYDAGELTQKKKAANP